MIPLWLMIAQGVKQVADNQNKTFNKSQPMNNALGNASGNALGNAFSTFSTIYGNYLDKR